MTMLKLKNRMIEPTGGWVARCPGTNLRLRAASFNKLLMSIRDICKVNKTELPPNYAELLEHDICLHTHKDMVANPDEDFVGMVTDSDMLNAMAKVKRSEALVTPDVMAKRSVICGECQHNCATVCMVCVGHDTRFKMEYALKSFPYAFLHVCQLDGTALMVAVQLSLNDTMRNLTPRKPYPNECWKVSERHE